MQRTQANRRIVATRATGAAPNLAAARIPATAPGAAPFHGTGQIKRTRCAPMTRAQKSANPGSPNLWSATPFNRPGSTPVTPAWDRTRTT